jgi:hypothetical protein
VVECYGADYYRGIVRSEMLHSEETNEQSRWEDQGGNCEEQQPPGVNQEEVVIPVFGSTEEAIRWGSHLNAAQHATVTELQRALSSEALAEHNPQRMVTLATQSQLLREAAEAFLSRDRAVA